MDIFSADWLGICRRLVGALEGGGIAEEVERREDRGWRAAGLRVMSCEAARRA